MASLAWRRVWSRGCGVGTQLRKEAPPWNIGFFAGFIKSKFLVGLTIASIADVMADLAMEDSHSICAVG